MAGKHIHADDVAFRAIETILYQECRVLPADLVVLEAFDNVLSRFSNNIIFAIIAL